VGLNTLAYISAETHGLEKDAEIIGEKLIGKENEDENIEEKKALLPHPLNNAALLTPPIPIMKLHESNWPLLTISKGALFPRDDQTSKLGTTVEDIEKLASGNAWGDNGDEEGGSRKAPAGEGWADEEPVGDDVVKDEVAGGGWDDDHLEGLDSVDISSSSSSKKDTFWTPPSPGTNARQYWTRSSNLFADHVAAGSIETAMNLLNQQIGAVDFTPLKPFFLSLVMGSSVSLTGYPSSPSLLFPLYRNAQDLGNVRSRNVSLPLLPFSLAPLVDRLKSGYRCTTDGQFNEALSHFLYVTHALLFVVVDTKPEVNEAKELLGLCREYVTGLRMELYRKKLGNTPEDAIRQAELAAYFTHCNLQPPHLILSLRSAMNACHKIKNYLNASSFAKRLLELVNNPNAEIVTRARQVIKFAEQNANNESKLQYDERNPFVVCGISFVPIYRGSPLVRCPYCSSAFLPEHTHKVCPTCQIAEIGKEAPGIQLMAERDRSRDRDR